MTENKFISILKAIANFLLDIIMRVVLSVRDLGVGIWHMIKGLGLFFVKFGKRFMDASIWTKIGHVIMGFGNFARKQIVKGCIYLFIEIIFIVYLIASPTLNGVPAGAKALKNFFTLGDDAGMKISRVDVSDAITEMLIDGKESGIDLTDDNYQAERLKTLRSLNLIEAIEANTEGVTFEANDSNTAAMVEKKNDDGTTTMVNAYDTTLYTNVIVDNRYNTNDMYGYAKYDMSTQVKLQAGTAINSVLVLRTTQEVTDFKDVITIANANDPTIGVFKYNDAPAGEYMYVLVLSTTSTGGGRKGANPLVSFASIPALNDAAVYQITYSTQLVNSDVDNSFLMMLFGVISFVICFLFLLVYLSSISSSYAADLLVREGKKPSTFIEDLKSLLDSRFHLTLLIPAICFIVIFTIIPTVLMIFIAFTNMNLATMISGQRLVTWSGFSNFATLFSASSGDKIAVEVGKNFFGVLSWTLIWALIATFTCYFGGIFLAILINKKDIKGKKAWRTIFILTIAIPQFITFLILRNMLTNSGPVNTILMNLHLISKPIDFLQSGSGQLAGTAADNGRIWLARGSVLVINLYVGIPYTMLMTSGILMNIPADLYEAATIDGANKWQMFRKITLPYIIFVTTPYLISSFIGNITSFNTIFLTTGGGPAVTGSIAGKTDLLVTWLYKMTIDESIYNAGSIIGILTFLITASLTLICYRNSKAYKEEDTFQ